VAGGAACGVGRALASGASVSIVARVVRQFEAPRGLVTLEKVLTLPSAPTLGTRLDLRAHGVETPLTVIGLTFRPENLGRSAT
jgi:hypothetical protein